MTNNFRIITGVEGYVGSEFKNYLEKKNIRVIGIDKKKLTKKNKSAYYNLDLKNKKKINKFLEKKSLSTIYHFGTHSALAYKHNFEQSFTEDWLSLSNLISSLNKNTRLVYLSSSYVYSGTGNKIGCENSLLDPVHNFGFAKKFFEDYILKLHSNSVIFRLSSVFGFGKALHPNAIYNLIKECKDNRLISIWGKGNRKMQYIYMEDVLYYLFKAKKINPGIYNLAGNEYLKLSFVGKKISTFFKSKIIFDKEKKEQETLCFMDNTKLKKAAGDLITPFSKSFSTYLNGLN